MGFDDGFINLDSPNLSYYAGQTIFGKLEFTQDKVKTFRGIYLKASGAANVHWTTDHQRKVNDRTEHYKKNHNAHEEYFSLKQYLVGSEHGEHKLNPGSHSFPFQVHIPPHCPSSFEGKFGHIRYHIKVVVDRAFKIDQEKKITFRVIAPLDLNASPNAREPIVFEFEEHYCCWCVRTGVVNALVKLPVTGYVPGQNVPIEVNCENNSSTDIHNIKIIIKKLTTFHAHSEPGTKQEEEEIALIKKGPIDGHSTKSWTVDVTVPTVDSCNVDACRIIDVDFVVKVKMNPDGCHSGSSATRKILIGTVPLKGFQDSTPDFLRDQMPTPQQYVDINAAPMQYPPVGFNPTNQNPPYLGGNPPYPGGNLPYPGVNPPYSGGNPPYPNGNLPYPGGNPPYPGGNPPYPGGNPPYPGGNPPYPGGNQPYLGGNPPYPGDNPPYVGNNPPNPDANSPYAGNNPPYPGAVPTPFAQVPNMPKSEVGNQRSAPNMPQMPDFNPMVMPSAPEPSTPDIDNDKESKLPLMYPKGPMQ